LEFELGMPNRIEPLMGWTSGEDPLSTIRLTFKSLEEAMRWG
jgi:hypothetical protein